MKFLSTTALVCRRLRSDYALKMNDSTLFLGDLSSLCTEADLTKLFSQHGTVVEVKISGTSRGISLNYGFVTMANRSEAEEAMEKSRGVILTGRPIRINWAARNVRDLNSYAPSNEIINSVHVRFRTLQVFIDLIHPMKRHHNYSITKLHIVKENFIHFIRHPHNNFHSPIC